MDDKRREALDIKYAACTITRHVFFRINSVGFGQSNMFLYLKLLWLTKKKRVNFVFLRRTYKHGKVSGMHRYGNVRLILIFKFQIQMIADCFCLKTNHLVHMVLLLLDLETVGSILHLFCCMRDITVGAGPVHRRQAEVSGRYTIN